MRGRTHRVFVYGSLLPGMVNHDVAAPHLLSARPGRVRGRLVDAGPYPALLWSPDPSRFPAGESGGGAVGEADEESGGDRRKTGSGADGRTVVKGMWLTVTDAGLAAMDRLEEYFGVEEANGYERVWVTDTGDPSVAGWAYVWTETRGFPVVDADWWPAWLAERNARSRQSGKNRDS